MKEDMIKTKGQVVDKLPDARYKVRLDGEHIVIATISNKMRKDQVRITINDSVDIELSPHDNAVGRIISRHK